MKIRCSKRAKFFVSVNTTIVMSVARDCRRRCGSQDKGVGTYVCTKLCATKRGLIW